MFWEQIDHLKEEVKYPFEDSGVASYSLIAILVKNKVYALHVINWWPGMVNILCMSPQNSGENPQEGKCGIARKGSLLDLVTH